MDGGVRDNQGIDGMLMEGRDDNVDYDLIIVSDASGQLEQANRISSRTLPVMTRTMAVFQHEIRNKELDKLLNWQVLKDEETGRKAGKNREFAFVHLFLNLKDRPSAKGHRVPSEYIEALGRIRTVMDHFSMVEPEALMHPG